MVDPVALPLRPEVEVPASHLFYDQDGEITEGMTRDVEVGIYWFLCSIILDVTAVSIEADVERILCFSHILLLASSAFDKKCRRWKKGIVRAGSQLKKRNSTGSWFSQIAIKLPISEGNYFAQTYHMKSSFEQTCFDTLDKLTIMLGG